MRRIELDGARLTQRGQAMAYLNEKLELPEWWGRNLDALHDCLTELGEPTALALSHRAELEGAIFGRRLLRVLEDAAEDNRFLWIEEVIVEDGGDGTDSG